MRGPTCIFWASLTPFSLQCKPILDVQLALDEHMMNLYNKFAESCLQLDTKSMVMALHYSTCEVCGDGDTTESEECDDAEQNSDAPNAHCRTDCRLGKCGDGVVDSGEGCDDAMMNSAQPNEACRPDCQPQRSGDEVIDDGEQCEPPSAIDGCTAQVRKTPSWPRSWANFSLF